MKHLTEDELLMAAFDEAETLSLDDLDQEQRKEFAALSGLKLDLKKLNDIPPCQLSSERLKRRLLEDGIRAQRSSRSGWFFFASAGAVSCACMALAAVMIWNWYQPVVQTEPSIVAQSSGPAPILDQAQPKVEREAPPVAQPPSVPASSGVEASPAPEPKRSRPERTQRRSSIMTVASAMGETGYAVRAQPDPVVKETAPAPEVVDSMPSLEAPAASIEMGGSGGAPVTPGRPSVIIIGQAPGQQPPAVESSGHVVFGG